MLFIGDKYTSNINRGNIDIKEKGLVIQTAHHFMIHHPYHMDPQ